MKNIKIVHITTVHPPFDTRIFYKECTSLAEKGYDVYLIHTDSEDFDQKKFDQHNIKSIRLKQPKNRFERIFKTSKEALKEAKKIDGDIYHIHDPELLMISKKLIKTKAKIVYDIHEDYYTSIIQKEYLPNIIRLLMANLFKIYENKKVENLNLILAEKYYRDRFPKGISVLNYPIIDAQDNKISYGNTNQLLYTGNVTKDRGAVYHSEIPTYVEDVKVQFVGKCSSDLANEIKRQNVYLNGINRFVLREEIDKYYTEEKWLAGLAIFPPTEHYKKKELTKFFEYMNAGLPIIASDFPMWKEFIDKYKCGITVKYNSQNEIKEAINFLQNNPETAMEMGINGKRAITEKLNWDNEASKLYKFYTEILN